MKLFRPVLLVEEPPDLATVLYQAEDGEQIIAYVLTKPDEYILLGEGRLALSLHVSPETCYGMTVEHDPFIVQKMIERMGRMKTFRINPETSRISWIEMEEESDGEGELCGQSDAEEEEEGRQ